LLETIQIPCRTLSTETVVDDLKWTAQTVMSQRVPVALLLKKGVVKTVQP